MIPEEFRRQLRAEGSVSFVIRVRPGARSTVAKETMVDGTLKVDVAAPADGGKANMALVTYLADVFGVPVSCVEVLSGKTGRRKRVRLSVCNSGSHVREKGKRK